MKRETYSDHRMIHFKINLPKPQYRYVLCDKKTDLELFSKEVEIESATLTNTVQVI